jgi:hypothetical protein
MRVTLQQKKDIMPAPSVSPIASFTDLLDDAVGAYRKHITKVLGLSAFTGAALLLFGLITPQLEPHRVTPSAVMAAVALGIVYTVVAALVNIAFYLLLSGQDKSIPDLLSLASAKLGPVIWVFILSSLCIMGGFLLLVIPGIIFAVWLTFASVVVVLEDKRGLAALKQSREYARGRWWAIFGRLFLLGICVFAASIAVTILIAILSAILGPWVKALNNVLSIFVLTPIATIFGYYLYRSVSK